MSENAQKPRIRFKGFSDAWEQRKLGDVAIEMVAGGDIDKNLILDNGRYPVIANALTNDGIVGYYSSDYRIKAPAVTVTGRGDVGHAKARLVNFTPVVRLLSIKSKHNVFFLENAINTLKIVIESTGVPQLTVPQLEKYEIIFPQQLTEEKKIGSFFNSLDNLITLHQRKYDKLVAVKKSLLEKMFPADGETVPKIRFKGFSDAWEQRKLGDYFIERNERSGDGEMISVTINSGIRKFDELNRHDTKPDDLSKYKRVEIGDIAYNSMRMWQGASGYSPYSGILSPAYTVITPKEGVSSRFFAYLIKRPKTIHLFEINSQGLTKDTWNLKFPAFAPIEVKAPESYEEQVNISRILIQLDNLIALHQREGFYIYKNYLLFLELQNSLQMNYSWEQRKAKDLCAVGTGKSNTQDQVDDGKYPFYIRSDVPVRSNKYLYDCEAVITIGDGNIGKVFHYVNGKFDLHQRCYKMTDFQDIWGKYFFYYFSTKFYDRAMKMTAKATVDSVRLEMISEMDIKKPPKISEQKQIAEFFTSLDNLITLHQCESCKKVVSVQSAFARRNLSKWADSWEQRKLGDATQITMGQSPDGSTYSDFPTDYILVQGNADLENGWVKPRVWTTQKTKYATAGDLIMSVRAPAGSMGKTAYNVVLGRGVAAIKGNEFIFQVLTKMDIEGFWKKLSAGSTFESLNSDNIVNASINLPSNLEQDKIGSLLENMDNLITLHQRQLEKLKNIKSALLEKMFV